MDETMDGTSLKLDEISKLRFIICNNPKDRYLESRATNVTNVTNIINATTVISVDWQKMVKLFFLKPNKKLAWDLSEPYLTFMQLASEFRNSTISGLCAGCPPPPYYLQIVGLLFDIQFLMQATNRYKFTDKCFFLKHFDHEIKSNNNFKSAL